MSAALLLSKLDGVRPAGSGRWIARCPAHEDRRPSLSIRETEDGKTLIHCFSGGCSAHEVCAAVGLDVSDLFPPRPSDPAHTGKPERRPFPATDILRAIGFEALVVACAASAMATGEPLALADRERLRLAASRIQEALRAGGLSHER